MTLVTLPQPMVWPGMAAYGVSTWALQAGTLCDAAGEYDADIFVPNETMVVSHVAIRLNAVVGSPTGIFQLESVDASGLPSGTVLGATNNAKVTSGTLTTAVTVLALGESATLNPGTPYCFRQMYNSGTSLTTRTLNNTINLNVPYRVQNTGTPTKAAWPIATFALGSNATTFYSIPFVWPIDSFSNTTFTNTNSAARGNKMTLPFKCRIAGIVVAGSSAVGDFNAILQDGSNNDLESTAYDGDVSRANTNLAKVLPFDAKVTRSAGDVIRFGIEPTSATTVGYSQATLFGSDYLRAMPGGATFQGSARATGTWTDDTDKIYMMDLLIDQLDDGAGGGGSTGISRARAFSGFA